MITSLSGLPSTEAGPPPDASSDREPKWSYSCRSLEPQDAYRLTTLDVPAPRVGDVALARVEAIGYHGRMMTARQGRLRLYPGDSIVGVFGNRYATAAFEGEVGPGETVHILTSAGMVGTVRSRHQSMAPPTRLSLLGYLAEPDGRRINLKERQFHPRLPEFPLPDIVLVVGTSMNSGKTTAGVKLASSLVRRGLRVGACKLTGSVCHRDIEEWQATGAQHVRDFSDYGLPSTYLCRKEELISLFLTMVADAAVVRPDILVMEVADGLLQRETKLLLEDPRVREHVRGVVLAATCPGSALFGFAQLAARSHRVLAVSGVITSSPLFVRELLSHERIPVASSAGDGEDLADEVLRRLCSAAA
ncbi:MAG: hypothetical protein H0V43_10115 [Gemmatimonadales bacterium]|nr:hypothetical protein [Gemmatimonadales bacterium]MBA3553572.1 hypothetical protein [Gemmatimonadales bacterium]